jgi:hypothetical protein
MPNRFASGKFAISECDRCGQRYKLKELRIQTVKTKPFKVKVCKTCWDPDHPQLLLGMYPVNDPQAVREPRPDVSYLMAGQTGLQILDNNSSNVNAFGYPSGGSREIQWGWAPVGGSSNFDAVLTPNYLVGTTSVGTVTITVS